MPDITADEIVTQKHKRAFIQYGGPKPGNPPKYAGQDAQYMAITGVGAPEAGGIDPIWVKDPRKQDKYRLVAKKMSAPDLAKSTLEIYEKHNALPRQLLQQNCPLNVYEPTGACLDLSDFISGWTDYVLVYSQGTVGDKDLGDRVTFDSDEAVADSLSMTWADIYPIGPMSFGDNATTLIDREVIDVVYGDKASCGNCGPENDGTRWLYALVKSSGAGSPGLPTEVVYSTDYGSTWTETNITGMGATEDGVAIDIAGKYLVVISQTAGGVNTGGVYFAEINSVTGVPGTWTKVTTGFVATYQPTDIYVASPREVYISAKGGYIYKSTDITSGVSVLNAGAATSQDLNRVHGKDEAIVCVGAAGAVVKSTNRGLTWAVTTAPAVATLQALAVMDQSRFWVGSSSGNVYYSLDGGSTWTAKGFSGSGSGNVTDIVFASQEVGYICHATTTPTGRVFTTWDGGEDWTNAEKRVLSMPVCDRINRVAFPTAASTGIAVNNLLAGGLAGDGTDGILLTASVSKI